MELTQRKIIEYSLLEQEINRLNTGKILSEIKVLELSGSILYDNQKNAARQIVKNFQDRKIINQLVLGKTQSGKTGTMIAFLKYYLSNPINILPLENIFVITGLSSLEWQEQTQSRFPDSVCKRIYHRDMLKKFSKEFQNKKNALIIMDEIHIASKEEMTIHTTFKEIGILGRDYLLLNDIKILEFTATPDGTIYDLYKWNDFATKVFVQPSEAYTSSYNLLQSGKIKQYKPLYAKKINTEIISNINELLTDIESFDEPRYHIIRTYNGIDKQLVTINLIKENAKNNYIYMTYDQKKSENINNILQIKPKKNTLIFIKEKLRCAKTIEPKYYIGVLYERYTENKDDSVLIQGLVGRLNGYDTDKLSICYTNVDTIERYEKLWNSNFEDLKVKWNSKTTKRVQGLLTSKSTFNGDIEGFSDNSSDINENVSNDLVIIKRTNFQDIKEYLKTLNPKYHPHNPKPNENGFYESTIRGNKRVYSCDEIFTERNQGLNNDNYRIYSCYQDKNNKNTLEFWLIYKHS